MGPFVVVEQGVGGTKISRGSPLAFSFQKDKNSRVPVFPNLARDRRRLPSHIQRKGKTMGDMHWMVSLLVGTIVLAALLAGNQIKEH